MFNMAISIRTISRSRGIIVVIAMVMISLILW